jgi:phosphoglycerol transferase MdoB-like AlkP superfamily enzyme
MMNVLVSAVKYILFWLLLFSVQRLIFVGVYFDRLQEVPLQEHFYLFLYGIRLDLSIAGYLLLLPILLLLLSLVFSSKHKLFEKIINVYTMLSLALVILLGLIDIGIYKEWGSKINSRAIEFLVLSPGEAMASSSSSPIFLLSISFILQLFVFIYLYKKYVGFAIARNFIYLSRIFSILILSIISVLMMRGGLQLAPINQSAAYFSKHSFVNHASLNTEWNLMHSVIENHFSNDNPYQFLDEQEAKIIVDSLYKSSKDSGLNVLTNRTPNIVFIILESYTSDVVEHFGGDVGVAPNLSRIAKQGISFMNIYASGDRTDKGIIAILSAFPSQAVRTIIQQPDKFEKLPFISKTLENKGYSNSFFYGGESEFANFKSYLISAGFSKIVDKNNFESSQMNSKWGAHDGFLFDKVLADLDAEKEPFFSVVLSLSSHEPFEVPVPNKFTGDDLPSKFRKAAHYTDQCLASFLESAKKEKWYSNTLFVIVADHGHRLPREYNTAYDIRKFRIPLLMFGEVIDKKYQGLSIEKIGSQTDIAATLLQQLNIQQKNYKWSKDLLNKGSADFAFYSYDNGLGWVDGNKNYTMDNVTRKQSSGSNLQTSADSNMVEGKAYMQMVFTEYLKY